MRQLDCRQHLIRGPGADIVAVIVDKLKGATGLILDKSMARKGQTDKRRQLHNHLARHEQGSSSRPFLCRIRPIRRH